MDWESHISTVKTTLQCPTRKIQLRIIRSQIEFRHEAQRSKLRRIQKRSRMALSICVSNKDATRWNSLCCINERQCHSVSSWFSNRGQSRPSQEGTICAIGRRGCISSRRNSVCSCVVVQLIMVMVVMMRVVQRTLGFLPSTAERSDSSSNTGSNVPLRVVVGVAVAMVMADWCMQQI